MKPGELHEKLLETWIAEREGAEGTLQAYGKVYFATAARDGVTLYTCPAKSPIYTPAGYVYEDGLSYIFRDDDGLWHRGFEDRSGEGQGYVSDFAWFCDRHPLDGAEWAVDLQAAAAP